MARKARKARAVHATKGATKGATKDAAKMPTARARREAPKAAPCRQGREAIVNKVGMVLMARAVLAAKDAVKMLMVLAVHTAQDAVKTLTARARHEAPKADPCRQDREATVNKVGMVPMARAVPTTKDQAQTPMVHVVQAAIANKAGTAPRVHVVLAVPALIGPGPSRAAEKPRVRIRNTGPKARARVASRA